MNVWIESLLDVWQRHHDYGQRLVNDLAEEQMTLQPFPGVNHPAWVLAHLNLYHDVLVRLTRGEPFDDPRDHPFGMNSKPQPDASVYPTKKQLLEAWTKGHTDVADAVKHAPESRFEQAMPLERWRKPFPRVGSILPYLMIAHEGTHLGQLSAWRRVQGLTSV